jgi:hypothetical protein
LVPDSVNMPEPTLVNDPLPLSWPEYTRSVLLPPTVSVTPSIASG